MPGVIKISLVPHDQGSYQEGRQGIGQDYQRKA